MFGTSAKSSNDPIDSPYYEEHDTKGSGNDERKINHPSGLTCANPFDRIAMEMIQATLASTPSAIPSLFIPSEVICMG